MMQLSPADRLWVTALANREAGRLDEALKACEAAARLSPPNARQLAFQADLEASLGLTFRAARRTAEAAASLPELAGTAARRLWDASLYRAAARLARSADPPLARLCAAVLKPRTSAREPDFVFDERLQLAGVVGGLAARPGAPTGFVLDDAARRWFGPHRKHRAVALYRRAAADGLRAVGLQRDLLRLEPASPERRPLLAALDDFARRSRLRAFFAARAPLIRQELRRLRREARSLRYASRFAQYAGAAAPARYAISLCPYQSADGSARLNHVGRPGPDGLYRIVSTLAPPFAYAPMAWSVWHELGHALTDHWLEGREASLDRSRPALRPASARRYGSWEQTVREHVVQGLATRLVRWVGAPPRPDGGGAEPALPYLESVERALETGYEPRRRAYPTLESFYPRLLEAFERLAKGARPAREGRSRRAQSDGLR